jgi:hypothetical protein
MCGFMQKKYVLLMFLRAYREAALHVNTLKDNIQKDIKSSANAYVE